jgi:hypothetical protein
MVAHSNGSHGQVTRPAVAHQPLHGPTSARFNLRGTVTEAAGRGTPLTESGVTGRRQDGPAPRPFSLHGIDA